MDKAAYVRTCDVFTRRKHVILVERSIANSDFCHNCVKPFYRKLQNNLKP